MRLHGATSQKAVIFILKSVMNLKNAKEVNINCGENFKCIPKQC
jgi:hypothetical protein